MVNEPDREAWWNDLEKGAFKKNPRTYLGKFTEVFTTYDMLSWWYAHFSPKKNTDAHLEAALSHYANYEDVMFNRLYRKYVDGEWESDRRLWFTARKKVAKVRVKKKPPPVKFTTPKSIKPTRLTMPKFR